MFTLDKENFSIDNQFYIVKNANITQNIPLEIKNKIKKLALEAGLYSQVVMIKCHNEVITNKKRLDKQK